MKKGRMSKIRKKYLIRDVLIGCALGFMGARIFGCTSWSDTLVVGLAFSQFAVYGIIVTDDSFVWLDQAKKNARRGTSTNGQGKGTKEKASVPSFYNIVEDKTI